MNPLVSVNLTTYNRAHLLPRALDSILDQTYPELEIVIVDDCSQDDTPEVVQAYQQKDARIKYFRHEQNLGLSNARNTAWRNSHGKYVAFMDDDDEWIDRQKTQKQVEILEKHTGGPVVLVCSSVRLFSDAKTYRDKIIERPKKLKSIILSGNGIMYTPAVMVVKDVIKKVYDNYNSQISNEILDENSYVPHSTTQKLVHVASYIANAARCVLFATLYSFKSEKILEPLYSDTDSIIFLAPE